MLTVTPDVFCVTQLRVTWSVFGQLTGFWPTVNCVIDGAAGAVVGGAVVVTGNVVVVLVLVELLVLDVVVVVESSSLPLAATAMMIPMIRPRTRIAPAMSQSLRLSPSSYSSSPGPPGPPVPPPND